MASSARVCGTPSGVAIMEDDLTTEEKDLLDRSAKKAKVVTVEEDPCSVTLVEETPPSSQSGFPSGTGGKAPKVQFQTTTGMGMQRKMVSYKDVCLGVNDHNNSDYDNLFPVENDQEKDHVVDNNNNESDGVFLGDPLCPVVRLSTEERDMIKIPWKRSIIVKVLGKRTTLRYFQARLYKLWQPMARMEDDLRRVAVWVRVPGLPIEFYDKRVLWRIGNVLGKTVKIDANTLQEKATEHGDFVTERAKFATICIEVDLNKILISKFSLEGRVYPVEYEGLHLVSFQCGRYGHRREGCPLLLSEVSSKQKENVTTVVKPNQSTTAAAPVDDTSFGPWMIVQKPQRRNPRNAGGTINDQRNLRGAKSGVSNIIDINKTKQQGSRFASLDMEPDDKVVPQEVTTTEPGRKFDPRGKLKEGGAHRKKSKGISLTGSNHRSGSRIDGPSVTTKRFVGESSKAINKANHLAKSIPTITTKAAADKGDNSHVCVGLSDSFLNDTIEQPAMRPFNEKGVLPKAARKVGSNSSCSLPLLRESLFVGDNILPGDEPCLLDPKDGRMELHSRPPDENLERVNEDLNGPLIQDMGLGQTTLQDDEIETPIGDLAGPGSF
ncbi:hypothetical protein SESBI_03016 [Sesbania bispinosa]|nr:hypothetical protein SESBI_03016 [Sesbania bispinosa]